MTKKVIYLFGLTVLITFALLFAWEFAIEDIARKLLGYSSVEALNERWEAVIAGAIIVSIALIIPSRITLFALKRQKQTEEKLRVAKEEAEATALLKDKFVSLVSHDLRSPLASIMGLMRVLNADVVTPLNEDQKALLQHMMKTGDGLVSMIDKLLDIGKLKTGVIKPGKMFLNARKLAALAAGAASHLASSKGIMIFNEVPDGHKIYADPDLFVQVLHNLVSNAVKFSDRDDIIVIFVPDGRSNVIAVKDTGIGIKDRDLELIFRHDEKTSTIGTAGERGSGLGLPLCADIMKAHGGLLTADSEFGKGSVFFAETPVVRPLILLVEGEDTARAELSSMLESLDATVIEAESGEEALAIMAEAKPHLVITDTIMTVPGGRYLLEILKKSPEAKDVPVLAITRDGDFLSCEKVETLSDNDDELLVNVKDLLTSMESVTKITSKPENDRVKQKSALKLFSDYRRSGS